MRPAIFGAAALLAAAGIPAPRAAADCILVQERGARSYVPHIAIHFGDPADVPANIQAGTALDKRATSLCLPIYAYNLWEGATAVELALHTPVAPLGFDRGDAITSVQMNISPAAQGMKTSLHLSSATPLCGPVLLGCLRLPAAGLPQSFGVTIEGHHDTGRLGVHTVGGEWRDASVDEGGARIGGTIAFPAGGCELHRPIRDLQATPGEHSGALDLAWKSGSGSFTLLRYRMDGRYPSDPWDGDLMALLPSTITRYSHVFSLPGDVAITAWSITRGAHGFLYAASNVECGSLVTSSVHLPIAVETLDWQQVKSLYR